MLFELVMVLIFIGTLIFMGVTVISVGVAIALTLVAMFLFGIVGMLIKWLPVILIITIIYYVMKPKER